MLVVMCPGWGGGGFTEDVFLQRNEQLGLWFYEDVIK